MVILIAVVREGYEDYKKAKYDKLYNNSKALEVSPNGEIVEKKWKDIQVGDIILIKKNDTIPADVVVLKSSTPNGYCYLETTNIDGESALKVKEAVGVTQLHIDNYQDLEAHVSVDLPDKEIYSFAGTMNIESPINKKIFLTPTNMLLRSGKLKNVEWIEGLVVYTGKDTKIMKNIK